MIENSEIKIDPVKQNGLAGLAAWPRKLLNQKHVQSTLGIFRYHHAFIPRYAHIVHPLNNLLGKNTPFVWTEEHTAAIDTLIRLITSGLVL